MLFNSVEYVVFLPVVLVLCYSLPRSCRWVILLAASYVFYMAWVPAYLALILLGTLVDYAACIGMERAATIRMRRVCLAASLALNLGLLFSFKYFGFFADSARRAAESLGTQVEIPALDVLLPVGISFYTFQTLSYAFEVYKGAQPAERHLGKFALYVAFFPQLVAGPIERPGHLLPQLRAIPDFEYGSAVSGMRLILWGLFKKVVVADRLAEIVDRVYEAPERYPGPILVLATVAFAFQILCDFSGYTDIAIGSARLFGVDLMQNFRRPYAAHSIREFWQRWHISLSTWFRDYVYIPLGGNRSGVPRHFVNLFLTFSLSGLWHGASWTFVIWGMYHAALYILGEHTAAVRARLAQLTGLGRVPMLSRGLAIAATFSLVCIGWVFFRANSLHDAQYILSRAPIGWDEFLTMDAVALVLQTLRFNETDAVIVIAALCGLAAGEYLRFRPDALENLARVPRPLRWATYLGIAFIVTRLGVQDEVAFIYFQF